MSSLSTWILSIAGVTILGVVIDFILPTGETNKYVKGVFAFIIIFVIVSPIPKWIKGFSFDDIFNGNDILLQEEYLYEINQKRISATEESIVKELKAKGIEQVSVIISANIFQTTFKIDAVNIDCFNMVLNEKAKNYNIKEEILDTVTRLAKVSGENVFIHNSKEV